MPRWSAWSIRLALIWLALAALTGAAILSRTALGLPGLARLIPAHAEMMLVGWMLQLGFGVAWWILPGRVRRDPNAITLPLGVTSLGLNLGIVILAAGVPFAGRCAELVGVATFASQLWPRIRGVDWGATGRGGDLVQLKK